MTYKVFKSSEMCSTIAIHRRRLTSPDMLSNPKLDTCCATVEAEEFHSESDSKDTTNTELSDTLSRTSVLQPQHSLSHTVFTQPIILFFTLISKLV